MMRVKLNSNFLTYSVALLIVMAGCKKENESNPNEPISELATVSTDRIENITYDTALVISTVVKEGKSAVVGMGIVWGKNPNPTAVSDNKIPFPSFGAGTFRIALRNLEVGTTYYVRSYATNAAGTAYSQQKSFSTTGPKVPELTTLPVTDFFDSYAVSGGTISNRGSSPIVSAGVVWSSNPNPTIDLDTKTIDESSSGSFTSGFTGLSPNTLYYVRAYATNAAGTGYGSQLSFSTATSPSDADGNTYTTIKIGTQLWMKENLKTSKYRNGDPITTNLNNTDWGNANFGAYNAIYDNYPDYDITYGKLYNWYAVADPRGLCPVGWHVPSDAEWTTLEDFLGGAVVAGGKMKSTGTIGAGTGLWYSPNADATNSSGFTGLPGGFHTIYSNMYTMGIGTWWSSTETSIGALGLQLDHQYANSILTSGLKTNGRSVRCLRD
jgi:uncharacterized protein (TIGR02145 family)